MQADTGKLNLYILYLGCASTNSTASGSFVTGARLDSERLNCRIFGPVGRSNAVKIAINITRWLISIRSLDLLPPSPLYEVYQQDERPSSFPGDEHCGSFVSARSIRSDCFVLKAAQLLYSNEDTHCSACLMSWVLICIKQPATLLSLKQILLVHSNIHLTDSAGFCSVPGARTPHSTYHEVWLCREENGRTANPPPVSLGCVCPSSCWCSWCHSHQAADGALLALSA